MYTDTRTRETRDNSDTRNTRVTRETRGPRVISDNCCTRDNGDHKDPSDTRARDYERVGNITPNVFHFYSMRPYGSPLSLCPIV